MSSPPSSLPSVSVFQRTSMVSLILNTLPPFRNLAQLFLLFLLLFHQAESAEPSAQTNIHMAVICPALYTMWRIFLKIKNTWDASPCGRWCMCFFRPVITSTEKLRAALHLISSTSCTPRWVKHLPQDGFWHVARQRHSAGNRWLHVFFQLRSESDLLKLVCVWVQVRRMGRNGGSEARMNLFGRKESRGH